MHCTNCGKVVTDDTKFCEHCGHEVRKNLDERHNTALNEGSSTTKEINDKQQNRVSPGMNMLTLGNLIVVGVVVIWVAVIYWAAHREVSHSLPSLTSCLTVTNAKMDSPSSPGGSPTYFATIYNGCSTTISDIKLKVNFYKNGDENSNDMPLDTEYIDAGITNLAPGDSNAISETVSTNADLSNGFNWKVWLWNAN